MLTALFIAARIIANPVSNVFQKQLAHRESDPLVIIGATHALLSIPCVVALIYSPPAGMAPGFWSNILIAAALAVSGNVLLVRALKAGDLSVLGPINAYKALISVVLGIFLIGETPSAAGIAGMLLILGGSYFVLDRSTVAPVTGARGTVPGTVAPGTSARGTLACVTAVRGTVARGTLARGAVPPRPIPLRLAALAFSATEAVFLKRALLLSSPLTTFLFWSILGLPAAIVAITVLLRRPIGREFALLQAEWRTFVLLAVTTGTMQLTTLFAFGRLEVGYSLALFQLSAVLSVFLGYRYFQEREIGRRLFGAAVMVAGAAIIALKG
jgi:drug/metabolite transporter (DMT)-like permease